MVKNDSESLFKAQREVLSQVGLKSYHNFMSCRKSYYKRPELVVLSSGRYYIDGLTTCKSGYCSDCVKAYLYKASLEVAKVEKFIQQEKLRPTMMTLTLPHKISDNLKYLKVALDKATRGLLATSGNSQNKLMKKINKSVGNVGYVLRNEISYTDNGWNAHCHIENLNYIDFSENQKNQLVDEFARLLEDSGFYFSRLDKYNIERKGGLIHFRENSFDVGYLTKFDSDNPVNLAVYKPEQYIEFARSFNTSAKIPLVKFKSGLKSKVAKALNLSGEQQPEEQEVKRFLLPDSLSVEEIKNLCSEEWLKSLM